MKLEIKLKDPKSCNDCPCLHDMTEEHIDHGVRLNCLIYGTSILNESYFDKTYRPKKCIKEKGL